MKNNKKKIVFLSSSFVGGGAEAVCINIANNFAANEWEVDLIVLNLKKEVYLNRISDKVNIVVLKTNKARSSFFPLIKYILKNKPKLILVFNYELTVILSILKFVFRLNLKIITRNINILSINLAELKKKNLFFKFIFVPLLKNFYHKVNYVINQSKVMEKDLINLYPQLRNKSCVIYNPVADHILKYVKSNNLINIEKKNYLLCVGRLEKQKAFHYAIIAFAEISKKIPQLRLKILGKGSLENELRQKVKELKISNKVDFENFQKNIIPYYVNAKATILTSLFEGYPNSLIESIYLNTPVVAFDCPSGPSEIILDGQNGYLVKYLDVEDLKKKILMTLSKNLSCRDLKQTLNNNNEEIFKQYKTLINSYYNN